MSLKSLDLIKIADKFLVFVCRGDINQTVPLSARYIMDITLNGLCDSWKTIRYKLGIEILKTV